MKMNRLAVLVLAAISVAAVVADPAPAPGKSHRFHIADIEKKLDALLDLEAELENEIAEEMEAEREIEEDNEVEPVRINPIDLIVNEDPCTDIYCSAGKACVVSDKGLGECKCVESCEVETDPRRRVCSNHNETWMTDCDLHRQRCLCEGDLPGCQDEMYKHLHIDYFGQCQQLPDCEEEELADFPRRMRDWLFNVMRDMADRQILSKHYKKLEEETEDDETQKWSKAVVWKWCDLDGHPKDKRVSRHELFPIRAPLYTLEHCIAPFLDSCDPNDDHMITLKEWGNCLQLDEEDIEDMEDICEDIRENEAENNNN